MDQADVTPVAVIGMACRLPGGIDSPERLWEALLRGDDLVTEIPPERWDAEEYYDPEPGVPGRSVSKWGAFLDDVAGFDSEFFGINEREAIAIDPQQRLLLETSWETMEHAGLTREAQAASGALGLMKAILALQHGVVPRNLHFTRLPGEMAGIDTKLFVPQEIAPWPGNDRQPRRAAVSSYGLSGTNVHAILEQAPAPAPEASKAPAPEDISAELSLRALGGPLLFALSSTSADELRRTAGRPADWVQAHDDVALSDLAYTLARRRAHRPVRTALTASSRPELTEALREVADGDTPYQAAVGQDDRGPVWVFSGQGSQWAAMGAQLLATEPVFAATVAQVEPLIACESGFSVTNAMSAPQVVAGIDRIQPTLFTMQVALAATLRSYGVRPGAVIGHSLGEVAAAVVAGALSPEDGVRVACRRSRLMSRIAGSGAMASVELPAQQVLSELTMRGVDDVVVAAVASPQTAVIGGATQTVRELVGAWEQRDVLARVIAVDVASHSPQVDPILDELSDALAELNPMTPDIPFYWRPCTTRARCRCAMPVIGCTICAAWFGSPRRCRRPGGRISGLRRAGTPPAADPRCRADRPRPRHADGRCGRYAPRTGAAAWAAWLGGRSAQCGRRARFLGALPDWAAGGCAVADLDAPWAAVEPRRSGILPDAGGVHRIGASAAGPACALAGGTGTPRLASAYAAANSWLDAFTLWRRTQGLPASAIAWGVWAEVGRITEVAEGVNVAYVAIAPDEGAYAFEALLRHDRGYTGYAPITGTPWLMAFAQRGAFAQAFRAAGQNPTSTSTLRAELDELPADEWPGRLRRLISEQVNLILRRSIDLDRPLAEYGVDSLGALELPPASRPRRGYA